MLSLIIKGKNLLLQILYRTIPTYLFLLLDGYWLRAIRWKICEHIDEPEKEVARVYDLLNCSRGNRFVVNNLIVHNCIYGIGAKKLAADLSMEGIPTSEDDAKAMIRGWWNTYKGVAAFKRNLEAEWYTRGGWVRNGIGRPIAVAEDKMKDLISRVVQSTAHDCLTIYIDLLAQHDEHVPFRMAIPDWHDQTMCECDKGDEQKLAALMEEQVPKLLNQILSGDIPLKMEAQICETVADSKGV